jgi:hypothetical protein
MIGSLKGDTAEMTGRYPCRGIGGRGNFIKKTKIDGCKVFYGRRG